MNEHQFNNPQKAVYQASVNLGRRITKPQHLTTYNASEIVPVGIFSTLPKGRYKIDMGVISRMPALKHPVMGKLWLDTYAFFIPNTLVDEKFEKLIGEGHDNTFVEGLYGPGSHNPNTQSVGQSITPTLFTPHIEHSIGTKYFDVDINKSGVELETSRLLQYLGLPITTKTNASNVTTRLFAAYNGNYDENLSAYRLRMYNLIYNTFFRHPFLQDPLPIDYSQPVSYLYEIIDGVQTPRFKLLRANRSSDYFSDGFVSSTLYADIGVSLLGTAPVSGNIDLVNDGRLILGKNDNNKGFVQNNANKDLIVAVQQGTMSAWDVADYRGGIKTSFNLNTDLSQASILPINKLREAITLQHLSEKALFGTDYKSILLSSFGVELLNYELSEPLFIGGRRIPIQIQQVNQTSNVISSSDTLVSPLGEYGGQSTTINKVSGEGNDSIYINCNNNGYGMIFIVQVVRHESVYQYGVDASFYEHDKFDYFMTEFQGLSNISVPEKLIYRTGVRVNDDATFNFQRYGFKYAKDLNRVSGLFASGNQTPLDDWHLADIYASAPHFDGEWIKDTTKEVLQRCIAVNPILAPQFVSLIQFEIDKEIPVASDLPGITRI